ncbi:hypothetical protein, conserved [Plasmodium vivax]|uniref:Pv-fam-d protein n=1 Tax=Plasmodium vivax TaxID=5855 RepID=A0A1G4GR73_PLAVI|nr:hypothetical protein, conserved [Plasmodium vivax]
MQAASLASPHSRMLKGESQVIDKRRREPADEKFSIDFAGDQLFTSVKNWYDEYNVEDGSANVTFGSIEKNMDSFADEYKKFTTDDFKEIKNKKEFKKIYDSYSEEENHDGRDRAGNRRNPRRVHRRGEGRQDYDREDYDREDDERQDYDREDDDRKNYDRKNYDREDDERQDYDREDDDRKDYDRKNYDRQDEDDDYDQRRRRYPSRRGANERRGDNSAYYRDEKKNQSYYDRDEKKSQSYYDRDDKKSPSYYDRDEKKSQSYYDRDDKKNQSYYDRDDKKSPSYYDRDDKKNQSYYDRDGKKNQSYYDLYDQKKSQSSYYDREEDEERYTKRTREAVKGDNVRNRMEELKNMNSYEAQMRANRSSDMLQRGNNFQTGNNFQRGNNFQKDNMPIPQQRRQSFGDTASQYSNKKKSSNPIKNFFQRIDRKVEKELLRSMYPQITGDNNHSQKNKSFSGKLKSAYSRFKIFTPVLGIVISAIIMTAEGYEFAPLFFAIAIIIIIYLIFKLRKVNKMIEAAYEDEEDEDEPAPKGLPNSAAMGRGLPNSAAMMRGIPNGGAPMMRGGMPNGGVAVIRPMTNGGIPVMRPMTNGAPMARPMANGASPMMRPMPNGQGNSWAPESNNRRRY